MYHDIDRMDLTELYPRDEEFEEGEVSAGNAQSHAAQRAKYRNSFRVCDAASHNYILATWAYRLASRRSSLEIGLFLCSDVSIFEHDTGVRVGLLMILQQAYRLTGMMKICFIGQSASSLPAASQGYEPRIPVKIRDYAAKYGVALSQQAEITDKEGRTLFVRSNLDVTTYDRIMELGVDPVLVAFQVQRGTWTAEEMHHILYELSNPRIVLSGEVLESPAYLGITYERIRYTLSFAVFLEYARHCIGSQIAEARGDILSSGGSITMEWTSAVSALAHRSGGLAVKGCGDQSVRGGDSGLPLLLCPFEKEEYHSYGHRFVSNYLSSGAGGSPGVVVCSWDFNATSREFRDSLVALTRRFGWGVLITKIAAGRVDLEIYEKLKRSRNFLIEVDDNSDI